MMVRRIAGKPLFDRAQLRLASRAPKLRRLVDEALSRDPSARPLFEAFLQSPEAVRRDLCSFLDAFFVRCLAPRWQEFDSRVREDAAARRRLIDRFGMTGMFRTLTRRFSVSGTRSSAQIDYDVPGGRPMRLELPGDAIVALTPSYFIWPHATLVVLKRENIDVRITYPLASPSTVRPRAPRWDEAARRLSAVADPTRLRMLDLLHERDLSTREFAGLLGLSEGGVSRHLAILREAKLVTSIRDGYFVLYRRSADGLAELATLLSGF
jgi:DNA-binding transcriptional ArsR family regulator